MPGFGLLKVLGKQEIKPFFNFFLQSLPSPCLLLNGLYLVTGEGLSGFLLNRQATLLVFFTGPAWAGIVTPHFGPAELFTKGGTAP